MKLLVESPDWVGLSRKSGWEAVRWSAVGQPTARDSEITTFAAVDDYVVLTHDLDLSAILARTHRKKPSVIQIRSEDVSPRTRVLSSALLPALQPRKRAGNDRAHP